jgi:hypothetical protein
MNIIAVTSQKHFRDFLQVPILVHKNEPLFIPPLRSDVKSTLDFRKNPYWQTTKGKLFVAYDADGTPIGRIGAFYNLPHQHLYRDDCGYFGYLEFIQDAKLFRQLTEVAAIFLRTQGAKKMVGPINPSLNYELGVLTHGFDQKPYFMMNYNPPWYPEMYTAQGFRACMGFNAYAITPDLDRTKIGRVAEQIKERYAARIEEVNWKDFKREALKLKEIYNDAFQGHWGSVPFSDEEFLYYAKDLTLILDKKMMFKVTVKGEPAGFILAIPNLNQAIEKLKEGKLGPVGLLKFLYHKRKIRSVKVTVAAIKKKFEHLGLGSVLYCELTDRARTLGYLENELSWVADDNPKMLKVIESMGGTLTKTYAVYEKEI